MASAGPYATLTPGGINSFKISFPTFFASMIKPECFADEQWVFCAEKFANILQVFETVYFILSSVRSRLHAEVYSY